MSLAFVPESIQPPSIWFPLDMALKPTLCHAFSKLTANHSAYFSESIDKSCVLRALSPTVAAGVVSDQRRRDMSRLGALSGLMIIGGWKSGPLSPLFIYFLLYSCDFHCLTSDLVEEWHPGLACLITEWIEMGHTGDLTPFQSHLASYHDLQVRTHSIYQCFFSSSPSGVRPGTEGCSHSFGLCSNSFR